MSLVIFMVMTVGMGGMDAVTPSACAVIEDDAARLACYDRIHRPPPGSKPVANVQDGPDASLGEGIFGLSGTQIRKQGGAEQVDSLRSVVTEVRASRDGKPWFRLENGQLWKQAEATDRDVFSVGATVDIRKASLGSFLASVPGSGNPAVRVRRVE